MRGPEHQRGRGLKCKAAILFRYPSRRQKMDILFKEGSDKKTIQIQPETMKDLAMDEIITRMSSVPDERTILRDLMGKLPVNVEDIRFRQSILRDLLDSSELRESLYDALSMIKTMKDFASVRRASSDNDKALYTLLSDLRSLSAYVETTSYIHEKLSACEIKSEGLIRLRDDLQKITSTQEFADAGEDIKKMLEDLSTVRSAVVGVNFTPDLTISEISAIEFLPYPTRSKYKFADIAAKIGMISAAGQAAQKIGAAQMQAAKQRDPLMASMAPSIEKHLKRHFDSIKQILSRYTRLDTHFITEMYEGFTFYLVSAQFAEKLKSQGYEICIPQIEETEDRTIDIRDVYNIRLALLGTKDIVKNDFLFSDKERLFILTGPNRGGKTILEQGIGIVSLMASLGLFVTASSFRGIPFKNILSHFPIDENFTLNYGRLGEEAKRVKEIVGATNQDTLILFNETYSTTSAVDGLYLSRDLLHILKEKGASVIFNTHIHELARQLSEMNEWEGKSDVVSLVMEIRDNVNTFKVKRSSPDSSSYAKNIAQKYGITYEQMKGSPSISL